ncbi:hypothetical protein [Mannheimia granulomatis]|uniref:hypothetical protein n=1 Tax=Mannheimia granulomatis TaxID=85402 RepID=UPI001427D267|nr:hypothetical protein [Mannheimia granulomatis]
MNNLNEVEREKRTFILSLINNPIGISETDIKKYLPIDLGRNLCMLKKYTLSSLRDRKCFVSRQIERFGINSYVLNSEGKEQIIDNYKFIENDYRERIKEDLVKNNLPGWDKLSYQNLVSLYAFYAFSEFVFYVLLGAIEKSGNRKYKINEEYLDSYKMVWFSRYFAQQSHFSDLIFRKEISGIVTSRNSDLFHNFIDVILDKYISFHPDYIEYLDYNDSKIFSDMRSLVEIVSFLSFQHGIDQHSVETIHNQKLTIDKCKLSKFGFYENEIKLLFKVMNDLGVCEHDRIATELDNGLIKINDINLKFAIKTVSSGYLTNMKKVGKWFENGYVLKYLKDKLSSDRFVVTDGVNDPKEKYDADVIIYDKISNLIYFCQIKHRITTIHTFFRDEFNEYCRNESLNHGVEQLCSLRSKILTVKVRERLISRLGKKIIGKLNIERNCRFILLHSIENLDMCTKNGISMYEWNTFRNLLQGRISYFKNKDFYNMDYNNALIDFSDIKNVQDYLIKEIQKSSDNLGSTLGPAKEWEMLNGARVSFMFNTSIRCMNRSFFTSKWTFWDTPLII